MSEESGGFAFDFDEDEDSVLSLLDEASKAGSAALDGLEAEDDTFMKSFESGPSGATPPPAPPTRTPVAKAPPVPEPEPVEEIPPQTPVPTEEDLDNLEAYFSNVAAQEAEKVAEVTPPPAPVTPPPAAPVSHRTPAHRSPEPTPVVPAPRPTIVRKTDEEQVAYARTIIRVVDTYRKFSDPVRNVISQLIAQGHEPSEDPEVIAIRAINSEEITFRIMSAVKEAKAMEPVDRVFFIIAMEEDVRRGAGALITAFTGEPIKASDSLSFSRALVNAIDQLDKDALNYITATEAVLNAVKG